ncbi:MAG: sulfatase, partial [Anaerolineae bacterium]|nr:sulfatase [Anaerolineae bacterium]
MPRKQPNVLFVVLDTQRRDRLSAYGAARETSPNLGKFAAQSTVFERAVAAAQWTVPSHMSMFTGLYPGTHQVTQANGQLSGAYPALAEILRGAGYHTVAFCNNPLVGVLNNGLQRGFERFYNYASAAPFRPAEERRGRLQRELLRAFRRYFARPLGNQFAHSDALFRFSLHPAFVPLWTRLINYKGNTAASVDDLMDYWGAHTAGGADKPLFAFLNLMGTHTPYNPPQEYLDRVAPDVRHNRHAYHFMREFNADAARWASPTDPPLADWERQALDDFYDAESAHQDDHLGRLLKYLDEAGALENTLVIICADHGEGHGDHGFAGHSFVVYQELVHVPLVIRYPNHFPAGKRIANNVSTRRLFHTVLEAA